MSTQESTSGKAVLARLTWMVLGPLALLLLTIAIVQTGNGWLTAADIAFFVALGLMLLGRVLEFRTGRAQTATGEPATRSDLNQYLVLAGMAGVVLYVLANLLGNHWLG